MKSALILVSSFLVVAAVHGSVLLETRDNDKSKDLHHSQGGNGTFLIQSNCSAPSQGTGQTGYGIPVTPVTNQTNQTSDGAPPSQVPFPKCFNLTDLSGNQTSVIVQFNKTSLAQGDQPLVNQTASPGGNTNGSSSDPQFHFCPSTNGTASPFANGTSVTFQEVPCPCLNNGTSPGGENGNSTLPDNGSDA